MSKKELKKLKKNLSLVTSLDDKKAIVLEVCKLSKIDNPCVTDEDYEKGFEEIKEVFLCLK